MLAKMTRVLDLALWASLVVCGALAAIALLFAAPPLATQLLHALNTFAIPVAAVLAILQGSLWALGRILEKRKADR